MIKKIKKSLAVVAVLAMTAGCFAGCGSAIDSKETVVTVGEEAVPMGVASMYARYQQAQMYNMYYSYFGTTTIFDQAVATDSDVTFGEQMKDDMIDMLVDMYLLRSHAADYGVALSDEEVEAAKAAAKSFAEANDANTLRKIGTTEADVAELMQLMAYNEKMYDAMVADVDTEVSDEEAQQSKLTYVQISLAGTETDEDGNPVALTDAEIAEKEAMAQSILDDILASDDAATVDMGTIAASYDETLTAVPYTYDEEDTYLDAAVFEAVAGLAEGEVADAPVVSTDGTSLFVVRFDAELDREATDAAKENVVYQRQQARYTELLEEWKAATPYEVNEEVWDKITITDSEVFTYVPTTEE